MKYPGRAIRSGRENDATVVREVQARLISSGIDLDMDGIVGPATTSAIKLFQTKNDLEADGIVGLSTWSALFGTSVLSMKPPNDLLKFALRIAESKIGVRESGGANRGKEVEMFLASVGLGPGHAWCMSFVYYCYEQASMRLGIKNPLFKTGRVIEHWKHAPREIIIPIEDARENPLVVPPGAIFMIDHGEGKGHTGLVSSISSFGLDTIEGNTNNAGSREGDGVYAKGRALRAINLGFLDYSRLLAV